MPDSDAGINISSKISQNNDFWVQVIGRGTIENGVTEPYLIRYGNNGTEDIPAPLIALSAIPYSHDVYAQIGTSNWQSLQDMIIITAPGSSEHPEKLEPGSSYSIPLMIIGYNNTQFSIIAGPLSSTNFYSPSVIESSLDGSCPSLGIPLEFSRTYPSGYASYDGPLGFGWVHPFDVHLERMGDGNIALKKGNRYVDIFGKSEDGSFVSYSGDNYLTIRQNDAFELLTNNGNVLGFNPEGWLGYLHDSKGNSINLTYDTQKKLVSVGHSSGDIFKFEYGDNGKISHFIDHAGRTTTYSYDPTGRQLSSVTTPDARQTQYSYISRMGGYALSSVKYPDNSGYTIQYDEQGNPVEQTWNNGKNKISYSYNSSAGTTKITDDQGNTGTVTMDPNGRIVSSESSNRGATRFAYDENGMITTVTDALGRSSRFDYEDGGNIVAVTDPLGYTTRLAYDNDQNALASISDARGNTLKFTYDDAANLVSITYPDSKSESFAYDGKGNLVRKTTRSGAIINYQNDKRGQLTRTEYPDGSFTAYTYDADGNVLTVTNRDGTISMAYNPGNQLTEIHYPDGNSFAYIYDTAGRLIQRTDKDGYTAVYAYDDGGNVIQVSDGNKNVIVKYAYDAAGNLIRKEVHNGSYTTYAYDSTGQISRLVNYNLTGSILSRFDCQYDASGNPVATDTLEGKYQYSYDTIGQLVKVIYPDGQATQYSYDSAGNRVSIVNSGTSASYTTNAMNQYTQAGPVSFSYDAKGNLISSVESGKTTTYQYNYDNRLIRVTSPEGIKEYTYDALGNRVGVTRNGNQVRYSVDPLGLGDVVAEYDGNGSLIARYTHGMGLVSKIDASGNEYAYVFDQNQDTIQIIDSSGKEVNQYEYSPFGEYRQKVEGIPNLFTYVGEYGVMDDGNEAYYMRMRIYDSRTGRFSSADPIFIHGGSLNLYTYAVNNPMKYSDVSGLRIDLNNPMGWT
ncbi:MAG: RHS repeat-associated core domain-containing protein, partial [Methanomicrobiales archaeon]